MTEQQPLPRDVMRLSRDCWRVCPMADTDRPGWVRCCIDWKFRVGPDFILECPHCKEEK